MKRNKKARPGAGTPGQGHEKGCTRCNGSLDLDSITIDGPVSSFLRYGSENGLTARELQDLTGWTAREINLAVGAERRAGTPILSDTQNGYFLPASDDEVRLFVKRMRHRADEILEAALAVQQWLDSLY